MDPMERPSLPETDPVRVLRRAALDAEHRARRRADVPARYVALAGAGCWAAALATPWEVPVRSMGAGFRSAVGAPGLWWAALVVVVPALVAALRRPGAWPWAAVAATGAAGALAGLTPLAAEGASAGPWFGVVGGVLLAAAGTISAWRWRRPAPEPVTEAERDRALAELRHHAGRRP